MPGPGMELIGEEELKEVLDVMKGGYLFRYGGADEDPRFTGKVFQAEREFADYVGTDHAVAVNSGTSALVTALAALGIGPGDEVIVPGYTFVASISSIICSQAVPVFAEIDRTFNLDPTDVEAKITPRTKAIMAVHMAGNPARLGELRALADQHEIYLVEDAAQACGATYHGKPVGSIGHIGIFSFNVYKIITSGDGGMVVTNDEQLYKRAFAFHDQGHSPLRMGVEVGRRPFIGLDFRFTELQAAVLLAQLRKLPGILQLLRARKKRYKAALAPLPGVQFRELTDPEGECANMVTVILPSREIAEGIARELGTKLAAEAGWHVYNNMEHVLEHRLASSVSCPFGCGYYEKIGGKPIEYRRGMLPRTDELLGRSINIGTGLVDPGLGAGYGIMITDPEDVLDAHAQRFCAVAEKHLNQAAA